VAASFALSMSAESVVDMLVRHVLMSGGPSNVCSFAACLFQERGDLNDPRSIPQARNVAFPAAPQIAHPAVACSRFPSRGRLGYAQIVLPAQKKLSAGRPACVEAQKIRGSGARTHSKVGHEHAAGAAAKGTFAASRWLGNVKSSKVRQVDLETPFQQAGPRAQKTLVRARVRLRAYWGRMISQPVVENSGQAVRA